MEISRALFLLCWSLIIAKTVTEIAMAIARPIQIAKLSMSDMIIPGIVLQPFPPDGGPGPGGFPLE